MTTGSVLAQFTITLSQAVSEQVAVEWHTADGTAMAGVDYAAAKGTVLFAPGQTAKTVDILVHGRAVGAEDRSFFVEMLPPTNAILGASIGECIIHVDTTGSTPVTQIIVPTGPRGLEGKSAYQVWLDLGNTGTEQDFINSYYPDPAVIAEDVAPLIDVGATALTAQGTESLSKPDATTVKAVARRVAYVGAAKIATMVLADGDNLIGQSDLTGDTIDTRSVGLYPRILRGTTFISPPWRVEPDGRLLIRGAIAGDTLYVCQYDTVATQAVTSLSREVLRRSYAEAGYDMVDGGFDFGGMVSNVSDLLLYEADGKAYSWEGALPKDVAPGSTPETAGGVGSGKWQSVDSATLRSALLSGPMRILGAKFAMRDFITPEDFNAPANGVDNDSPAAQLALNAAITLGKPLLLNGNYCFFDTVEATTTRKVSITGTGVIHHKKGAFKLSGVVGPEIDTTVSINDFNATSLSLADAAEFDLNDLGIIHSATMCLSEDAGSMQLGIATASGAPSWFGEFFRVAGKAGSTIDLVTPLIFNRYRTTPQPNSGARTKTTVKKVTPVRGSISGNLTFLREGNANTAVEITYGDGFTVKGRFYSGKIAGSAVVFKYCYMCEVGQDSYFNIDAATPINFGSVVWPAGQVSAGDYYNFNSVKCVSSQMCGCSGAMFENTSQTFDITYDMMPSIGCYFKGNKVMFARFNMATSHGGSFGNMFDSNIGVACWRGIASRSREDCITNNRILGFRRFPTNPNTNGDTYGIGLTEGFTIGNTVIGNYISGFLRDVYINAGSSRGAGLDYMRITVESNRMSYCRHHVDVDLSTPSVKGTESGISISNNEFDSNARQSLNFGQYLTAVIIRNNVWVDAPSEDFYVIATDGNCKNFDISGNSFKKSTAGGEKYVWMKSITDPDLGPDTVQNANVTFRANVVRGTVDPDGFVYGTVSPTQVRLPPGSGFESMQTGGALRLTGITGDYTLDPLTANNVAFSPSVAFNVLGITGGNNGRDLVLWNNSGTNAITVKNSATVQTRSNADVTLTANTPLHLRYMNSKWREV